MTSNHAPMTRRGLMALTVATLLAASARIAGATDRRAFLPTGRASVDHGAFDLLLRRHVKPDRDRYNRVDYAALKREDARALKAYVAMLSSIDPASLSRAEGHAFWINLYNARTLEAVIDHYPVASIRNIRLGGGGLFKTGPWSRKILTVGGIDLSLDDVEHDIVRALFRDPMSHYGLNCASYSCPNLAARAFTGENLDRLLAENARDYVNHPRGISIADGTITASRIYDWYAEDFGGDRALKAHWMSLAKPELARRIESASIGSFVYDWSLNDA